MPRSPSRNFRIWPIVAIVLLAGFGYLVFKRLHGTPAAMPPMSAVPVDVITVQSKTLRSWHDYSGRTRAVDQADIRPEVSGRITEIRFHDGQMVKANDVLLVIEPRPYQAALSKAKAALATAESNAAFAKLEAGRANKMITQQAIARRLVDQRGNDARVAAASVESAKAELLRAQVDLEHAYVRSPIAGRAGRTELTVGNLVEAGPNAPLLTSIVNNRFIYCDFEVDEQTYLNAIRDNAGKSEDERRTPVELRTSGDDAHPYTGTIYSFDNRIDSASGTIRARAKFKNDDGALVPGMFVSVRLASSHDIDALTVPEAAIGTDQSKKFVYVVGADNKAQYREITPGDTIGSERVVTTGLKPGERVITGGIAHVRPDAPVAPTEAKASAATAAP